MKFKSQVYTAVSGSIGGITYSHNAGGMYARGRAIPTDPASTRQQIMRMYMDSAVTYWTETLTEAERESWRVYAANTPVLNVFGDMIHLSGQQHWVRSGVAWLLAGKDLADISTAPTVYNTGDPGALATLTVSTGPSSFILSIGGTPGFAADDDGGIFGFLSNPQNPSINFYKAPFRFSNFTSGNSGTPITTATFLGSTADPPISWASGEKMFCRARALYGDGRLTQAFVFDGIST